MDPAHKPSCGDDSLLGVLVIPAVTTGSAVDVAECLDPATDRDGFWHATQSLGTEMTQVAVDSFRRFGGWAGDDPVTYRHWAKLSVGARSPLSCLHGSPRAAHGLNLACPVGESNRLHAAANGSVPGLRNWAHEPINAHDVEMSVPLATFTQKT